MTKNPDSNYAWFLRYTNTSTRQICLRPITNGTIPEIANILFDIYCDQGAPVVLQSLNGREFVQQVIVEINKLYPQCRQLHSELQDMGNGEPDMILTQLYAMMKRFNSHSWSKMLRILQFELNTAYQSDLNGSAFERTYNKPPSMGLKNSKLIDILYERTSSIDDFVEYLADAELIRVCFFRLLFFILFRCPFFASTKRIISRCNVNVMNSASLPIRTPQFLQTEYLLLVRCHLN
jgi:predicted transcriptional regulator with HTH domain